ncbi:hypothetical protein BCR41DRAFT_369466 [Lobosporangium transversale]|uniref:Transcription activator GCR1-like domain-containing protein n=1 Tax=Lobosporangium transversale TaxID=64571 RepID=A0A1Y2GRU3_9FUNG|nr:hypothetical protein BCR41DRAFT_369466 [Lobosporangium transversale]ORZ20851.1 hypothetical protein BCR41DRAFT_369466 [Lobosporangium transversale]|eukprot:XP_021882760.1 hypothetical protein BCR41DRAFT_369466 [Lobosporangium transversale]
MTVRELERVGSSIKMSITQSRQLFFETLSRVAQEAGRKEYIKVQQEKRQLKAKIQQPALQGILGRLSREVPSSSSSGIDNLSPPRDPEDYQQGSESESGESDSGQESEPVEPVEPVVINETVIAVDDHSHDDQDLCDQFNEALGTDALDQNWEDQEGQEDQEAGQNAEGQRRWDNEKELEKELGMRLCPYVPEFHYMEMEPRDRPIRDLWKEWFYGNEEKPSICRMEIEHGSRWRPGNAKAAVYLFKKRLINSVLREMTNAEPNLTVEQRIFYALDSVHLKISQAGSINKYEKSLPKGAPKRRRAPVQEPDQQGQLDQQDQLEQQDQLGQQDA